jgi:hypothetical protein
MEDRACHRKESRGGCDGFTALWPLKVTCNCMYCLIFPSSGLLHGVSWFKTDVSGLPIGSILKSRTDWPLNMGPVGSTETSVLHQITSRNNSEDGRIKFSRGGSLWSRECTTCCCMSERFVWPAHCRQSCVFRVIFGISRDCCLSNTWHIGLCKVGTECSLRYII